MLIKYSKLFFRKEALIKRFKIFFLSKIFDIRDQAYIIFKHYKNIKFAIFDLIFLLTYLFINPYRASKNFLKKRGYKNIHQYGETPISSFEKILKKAEVKKGDLLIELGSGRGRVSFFSLFFGCQVIAVERIPLFIKIADIIKRLFSMRDIDFLKGDMRDSPFERADFVYLYGSLLEEDEILALIKSMKRLKKGAKVITISYPLTDYDSGYRVISSFPINFSWGKGSCFINLKL